MPKIVIPGGPGTMTNRCWQAMQPIFADAKLPNAAVSVDLPILTPGPSRGMDTEFVHLNLDGPATGLYQRMWYAERGLDGHLFAQSWGHGFGAETATARDGIRAMCLHAGPRHHSKLTTYSWWDQLPDKRWIGVRLDGVVQIINEHGHSVDVMGLLYRPERHPLTDFPHSVGADLDAWELENKEMIGIWEVKPHTTPGMCVDIVDPSIIYVTDHKLGLIHKINWVDRVATVFASGLVHPMGICMTTEGKIVVACQGDLITDSQGVRPAGTRRSIWRFDRDGTGQMISDNKMNYFWVAPFSDGKVAMLCWNGSINDMDVSGAQATWTRIPVPYTSNGVYNMPVWCAISVDRWGNALKKDTILYAGYNGTGYVCCIDRATGGIQRVIGPARGSLALGLQDRCNEAIHYPWINCVGWTGEMLTGGSGGSGIRKLVPRPTGWNPGYYDGMAMYRSRQLFAHGGDPLTPLRDCRSLFSFYTPHGASWMGWPSFDVLAYYSDTDLNAWLRDWYSSWSDVELLALRWFIRSNSVRSISEPEIITKPSNGVWAIPVKELYTASEFWSVKPGDIADEYSLKAGWPAAKPAGLAWHREELPVQDGWKVTRAVIDTNPPDYPAVGLAQIQWVGLPVNHAPEITSTPLVTELVAGELWSYPVVATDADGDELIYALVDAPDDSMTVSEVGLITWLPTVDDIGNALNLTVAVTDTHGATATQTIALSVRAPNEPPIIETSINTTAIAGSTYAHSFVTSDPDGGANIVTLGADAPTGMSISTTDATTTVTWDVPADLVGLITYTVHATDDENTTVDETISIDVRAPNRPPVFWSLPPDRWEVGVDSISYVSVTDEGPITLSLAGAPPWISLVTDETIPDTPYIFGAGPEVGTYEFDIVATDAEGASTTQHVHLSVFAPEVPDECEELRENAARAKALITEAIALLP